jgi:CRISPR-associated protein Cmr6
MFQQRRGGNRRTQQRREFGVKWRLPTDTAKLIDQKGGMVDNFYLKVNKYLKNRDGEGFNHRFFEERRFDRGNQPEVFKRINDYYSSLFSLYPNVVHFSMEVSTKLIIGIGNPSVYETGLTLHPIYGIPYIPGSAVKGALRSYLLKEYCGEDLLKYTNLAEKATEKEAANLYQQFESKVFEENEWLKEIFGFQLGKEGEGDDEEEEKRGRGKVIFFDAFPGNWVKIEKDIINPHYPKYYRKEGPPTDDQFPVPVHFLAVKGDFKFSFRVEWERIEPNFLCPQNLSIEEFVEKELKEMLKKEGIGAKTAVGYGVFSKKKDFLMKKSNWNPKRGVKLLYVHIRDEKVLEDFEINFTDNAENPLPVTVIAGANGTGKTTLLELLWDWDKKIGDKNEGIFLKDGEKKIAGPLEGEEESISPFIIYFPADEISKKCSPKESPACIPTGLKRIQLVNEKWSQKFWKFVIDKDLPPSKVKKELDNYLNPILREIEQLNFEFAGIDKNELKVKFKNTLTGKEFTIDGFSSGEKNIVSTLIYLYFLEPEGKVILIDEPEASLHPIWHYSVFKIYQYIAEHFNCQIILATHSPLILGSAPLGSVRVLLFDEIEEDGKFRQMVRAYNLDTYGKDVNEVLEEMGLKSLRTPEIEDEIRKIRELIDQGELEKAKEKLEELEGRIDTKELISLQTDIEWEEWGNEED